MTIPGLDKKEHLPYCRTEQRKCCKTYGLSASEEDLEHNIAPYALSCSNEWCSEERGN